MFFKHKVILLIAVVIVGLWVVFEGLVPSSFLTVESSDQEHCSFELKTANLFVDGNSFEVEIADIPLARQCGLSYRESLKPETGMLFVFGTVDFHSMWMKEMRFPLDIIWLDEELRVIYSAINVLPSSFPSILTPDSPVTFLYFLYNLRCKSS